MILTDASILVALLDLRDPDHARCSVALKSLPPRVLLSTWPCFTEAMYLLGTVGGHLYQARLWELMTAGRLRLHDLDASEQVRMIDLMRRYADTPMDLADASLVAAAETLGIRQIFSLDSDFYVYRLSDGSMLQRIP